MAWIEHEYHDRDAMAAALVSALHVALERALAVHGHASMALAGGRTPLPLYRALARMQLDWSRVLAMPGDERCVPHDHDACNVTALRKAFADADGLCIESLTVTDGNPKHSIQHARSMLLACAQPFDIVLLGMGEDAHTASLFPGADGLTEAMAGDALHDAFLLTPDPLPPEAPFPRITLGLARLLRTRQLHLLVTGMRKREVLRVAKIAHDPLRSPVSALLHAHGHTVHLHWSP